MTNRGVEQRDIFLSDHDRRTFLDLVAVAIPHFHWRLHTYVLMGNHFHLLIETIEPTLSRGMKKIAGDYAEAFNLRHRRVGHLFQGRFKAHLIDSETYLLTVARYIALNPVRAKMVANAGEWRWSSHRATAGLAPVPSWLSTAAILDRFDPLNHERARLAYRQFVGDSAAGAKRPWDELVGQLCVGSAEFVAGVQERIDQRERSSEHPQAQRLVQRATLAQIVDGLIAVTGAGPAKSGSSSVRTAFADLAHSEALAPLKEIGAVLGIGATGASYLVRQSERRRKRDGRYAGLVERVRLAIRNCRLQT